MRSKYGRIKWSHYSDYTRVSLLCIEKLSNDVGRVVEEIDCAKRWIRCVV
jgi:hypothetical protein